ncbi:MAG: glucose-6-phosphate isomerase [Bacillota bacterium]|jgi:glucose-6-phosphate isomerase|nr:glucose-6-phosphate isomerase [Bacillota bacterium]
MNQFDWDQSFLVDFDKQTGRSKTASTTKRYLSNMKTVFTDQEAAERILASEDPLIYEFYELGCPERAGDLLFGTTIIYPGKVGAEYFMTKGHFHTILETAEVYYTLSGQGYMVMENPEGETREEPLTEGAALYVPRRFAHRTVNTGTEPLVLFFAFAADAGHDYGTIEEKGFHKMILDQGGKLIVTDNPNW